MDKDFWRSWTFWGSVALGLSFALEALPYEWAQLTARAVGAFLTAFGLRRALK